MVEASRQLVRVRIACLHPIYAINFGQLKAQRPNRTTDTFYGELNCQTSRQVSIRRIRNFLAQAFVGSNPTPRTNRDRVVCAYPGTLLHLPILRQAGFSQGLRSLAVANPSLLE